MTDQGARTGTEPADVVVMAASAIETVRLALLSDFPDRSGKLGRRLMLHAFIDGSAIFLDERMHAHRGRSVTQCAEDAADPDYPGARAFAQQHGLPYHPRRPDGAGRQPGPDRRGADASPNQETQTRPCLRSSRSARPSRREATSPAVPRPGGPLSCGK
jgi:hypothetical protein